MLNYVPKESIKAGFSSGGCIFVKDVAFSRLIKLLKKNLQCRFGLFEFFLFNQGLKFFNCFPQVGLDIKIMEFSFSINT